MTDETDNLRTLLRAHIDRASRIRSSYPPRLIDKATDELEAAIYDLLGRDHVAIFTEDRWSVEHSLACRLSGQMPDCEYHKAVANVMDGPPTDDMLGRWKLTGIDNEGCPAMEREMRP